MLNSATTWAARDEWFSLFEPNVLSASDPFAPPRYDVEYNLIEMYILTRTSLLELISYIKEKIFRDPRMRVLSRSDTLLDCVCIELVDIDKAFMQDIIYPGILNWHEKYKRGENLPVCRPFGTGFGVFVPVKESDVDVDFRSLQWFNRTNYDND